MGIARWRRSQSRGDELGFLPAVEKFVGRRRLRLLTLQRLLETQFDKPLMNVLDRLGTAGERLRDLGVRQSRPVGVRLQQNLRPPDFLTRPFQLLDHLLARCAFGVGQPDDILLYTSFASGTLPGSRNVPANCAESRVQANPNCFN